MQAILKKKKTLNISNAAKPKDQSSKKTCKKSWKIKDTSCDWNNQRKKRGEHLQWQQQKRSEILMEIERDFTWKMDELDGK